MKTLTEEFIEEIKIAVSKGRASTAISKDNVFQKGDAEIVALLDDMVGRLLLPGSGVDGLENLEELLAKAESGKSCLLLLEHYSNFDLTIFALLARRAGGRGAQVADALVAIAGAKLNEDNPVVAAFAAAYTRVIIYPGHYLKGLEGEKKRAEAERAMSINRAAMRSLEEVKKDGKLVLVFPAGTRYRPWDPETKRGAREIDSYLRSFDYMCCVALNGEILRIQKTDMMNDLVRRDLALVTAGPVTPCAEFRERALRRAQERADLGAVADVENKKRETVDAVMAELEALHLKAEEKRLRMLAG